MAEPSRPDDRTARLEYLTLLVRQLLLKCGLDRGAKLKSVVDFCESKARQGGADAAREFATQFDTSIDDATVFTLYFSTPRNQMSSALMDQITASLMRLPDTSVEGTDALVLSGFLNDEEIGQMFQAAQELSEFLGAGGR